MNTCKTCAHWADLEITSPIQTIRNYVWNEGNHRCSCPHLKEETGSGTRTDELVYSYEECGWFETGPDFGCVHHLERETGK